MKAVSLTHGRLEGSLDSLTTIAAEINCNIRTDAIIGRPIPVILSPMQVIASDVHRPTRICLLTHSLELVVMTGETANQM